MRYLLLITAVACTTPSRLEPIVPTATPPTTLPAPATSRVDEHDILARSHAWFDAFDRLEVKAVTAQLAPSFANFEDARFIDATLVAKILEGRIARHAPTRSRTWSDEHVFTTATSAVFVGHAVENIPADGDQPASEDTGYHTLFWVREHDQWMIAHWQWVRWGLDAERERWNAYFKSGTGFNPKPNQLLVESVKGVKPGFALDVEMGQGRNAVFLATQGWKTTGVDISDEGLRIAKEAAARLGVKLDAVAADIDAYNFGQDKWDLVTLIYAGASADKVKRIIPSIRKGGLFVCEYFHADSDIAKTGAGGWKTGALAELFKTGFTIVRDDVVEDNADWAGQRKTKLVRFVARRQ